MSLVDYGQTAEDHQSLLILVRHTGSHLPTNTFNKIWDKIRALKVVHVQGQNRNVSVRYKRGYPKENNEWGDFQAHRKVVGLVSVGKCVDHEEFGDLFENYKKVKEDYASTIINSRLIIFGMNTDGSPIDPSQQPTQRSQSHSLGNAESDAASSKESSHRDSKPGTASSDKDVNNSKDVDKSKLEKDSCDSSVKKERTGSGSVTISGLGKKTESIPHERGSEVKVGKKGSRSKEEEQGRPHSNSLTKESTGSEVVFYPNLDQCSDLEERLKEFVTSLFFVLEGKRLERTFERSDRLVLLCAPFEKKDYIGVDTDTKSFKRKCMGRLRKHLGDLCLQASLPGEAILHYQTALDLLRTVNDFLWMGACYEGLCSASVVLTQAHSKPSPVLRRNQSFSVKRGLSSPDLKHKTNSAVQMRQQQSVGGFANGVDHLEQPTSLHCLNPDDIIEKYKEAITNYSKYKNSAMVEMEASLKACRVLIYQRKFLQASDFLQNVVYINLVSSEEDKIQRYSTLSSLYGQIGFHRKEAFFRRVAAMQCVSPGSNPAWQQCYQLLLQAVLGYNVSLDPRKTSGEKNVGWPVIQHRVLHELVYTARRMGNPQLAVRHSTLLLHTMYLHLTAEQQKEAVTGLETLTAKCQGVPQPLTTDTGLILAPVHLNMLPTVRSFKLLCPPSHLQPVKSSPSDDKNSSIFIYTPLSLGQSERRADSSSLDFQWVAEDMCEVQMQLVNPLSVELRLLYMGLLMEGVKVEVFPASPTLPPLSPLTLTLMARPQASGQLTVLGYDTQVFGVKSHCRLRDISTVAPSHFNIDVVPALPQVSLSCSLPKAATFSSSTSPEGASVVANAAALLYAGQSQDCLITLHNISAHPITSLSLKLDTRNEIKELTEKMFQWCDDNIQSQLPLQPGGQLCINVCLTAHSDFLLPPVTSPDVTSSSVSSRSHGEGSDKGTLSMESVLCVQYSGGPGLDAGYCRRCSVSITVDILPSLYITNWDVLPADCGRSVSLVLDLLNASSHQTDVQCDLTTSDPSPPVIIESQQCRRVAVTIPRVTFPERDESEKFESRIPVKYRSWRPPDFYSHCLSSYVDLQWTMPAAKVNGKVMVDCLKWSPDQLDCIRQSDVNWEVTFNNQHYTAPDLMTFPVSTPVHVFVSLSAVTNNYDNVTLTVLPTQEGGQGDGHDLDPDSILCLGSHTVSSLTLGPDSPVRHSCSFLFLSAGRFQVHISCSANEQDGHSSTSWSCLPVPQFSITAEDNAEL